MAAPGQRSAKGKAALPPHYYEGFLEKKNPWDQDYKKYWAGLWGSTLYFYHTNRESQYIEKIDLTDLVSLAEDNCPRSVSPMSTEKPGLVLRMLNQEIKLRMESLEQQEMWKGFILTMVEMKVPATVSLLPGHLYRLSESLEMEKERRSNLSGTLEREEKLPNCFFQVSRTEAVALLEQNENYGNMLLRPGQDGKSFSLTVRQKAPGAVSVKHYKINAVGGEYVIVMEKPNYCSSLMAVLDFFITKTRGLLVPLNVEKSYAMALEVVEEDQEGELGMSGSPLEPGDPQTSPGKGKLVKQKSVESLNSWPSPPPPLPPIVPIPPPRRPSTLQPVHIYEEEDPPETTYVNEEVIGEDDRKVASGREAGFEVCSPSGSMGNPPALWRNGRQSGRKAGTGVAWDQPGDQEAWWKGPPPPVRVPPKPPKKPPKPGSSLEDKSSPRRDIPSTKEKSLLLRSTTTAMTEELKRKLQERRAKMED